MTSEAFRDWVERARGVHVNAILATHHIELVGRGNRRAGPCPKCGGEDRFAVDLEKQLFNCRGCGGKGHGAISLVRFLDEVSFLQAVEEITGEPPPKDEPKAPKPARGRRTQGRLVCSYAYVDEHGEERFQVCRYDPKNFSQRQPDADHPGQWIGNLTGVRMVPYRLPDLIEGIANGHPVYIVEGEKDADNGAALGLVTTTTAMGTAGRGHWQRGVYDEFFRGADVVLVPDQDDDDNKGRELGRIIAQRLKPIAARVRVLDLPDAKDLSDWIEHGGTREDFDALPLGELPVDTNGGGYVNGHDANGHIAEDMSAFTDLWQPPGESTAPKPITTLPYNLPDPANIPPREWLYGWHYMRTIVTATVAPGGFGKTTLSLHEVLNMVTQPSQLRVWYVSGEDDTVEIDRRIAAHCKERLDAQGRVTRKEITAADIGDRLFVDDKMTFPLKIAKSGKTGIEFDTVALDLFERVIVSFAIDVVILDPFISFHLLSENDTAAMDALVKRLGEIALRTRSCIELSHHVRKPGLLQSEITVYDARGAAAIVNAVRSCRVLNQMSVEEAKQAKIPPAQRGTYIRVDSGKRNMAPPEKAHWLHLISVEIANGDRVQAIEPYKFSPQSATMADDDWCRLVASQKSYRADSRSDEWFGHEVAKHFNRDSAEKGDLIWIQKQIARWVTGDGARKPVLRKVQRLDEHRKPRIYFEVIPDDPPKAGTPEVINLDDYRKGDDDDAD
jgi:hypothetical protein